MLFVGLINSDLNLFKYPTRTFAKEFKSEQIGIKRFQITGYLILYKTKYELPYNVKY